MLQNPVPLVETHWWAILIPSNAGEFWQFVAAVAGVVVVIVAAKGLRSLRLTQEDLEFTKQNLKLGQQDIETRSQREAISIAIDQATLMRQELFPLYAEVLQMFATAKVPMFVKSGSEVSFSEKEEEAKIESAREWIGKLTPEMQVKVLELMNSLEIWAMPFTYGLADEKKAFEPCSSGFCQIVITLYPTILFQRRANKQHSGPFQNVVKLFMAWQGQKELSRLLTDAGRWQVEGVALPPAIGTNLDKQK
jgi:hypothetical protein